MRGLRTQQSDFLDRQTFQFQWQRDIGAVVEELTVTQEKRPEPLVEADAFEAIAARS